MHPGGLGVLNARDVPCPEAGSVPCCAPLRRASSISPPAIGTERDASAGRGRAVLGCGTGPSRVVEALRQGRARAAQAAHALGAAAPPMARWHEPAGADERTARPSTVHGARTPPERGRCVAHRRSDGTTSPRARSRRPRARAAGMFERGDKREVYLAPAGAEAKTTPRRCPWDRGWSPRTVRPPQDHPACASRASSCLGGLGGCRAWGRVTP